MRLIGNILDIDNYIDPIVDVGSSVVDSLPEARKILGEALQFVAPIVANWPGIGTAVSVAMSAAAAVALGTPVDEALINTVSNALPGGLPRIAFNGAVSVARDVAAGRNAFGSVVETCRAAAKQAGGDPAVKAFDTALATARGQSVSDQTIALARAQVAQSSGTEGVAAFDAGIAVSRGEGADDVLLVVARDYIASTNNPVALAAFDTGVALAHGQSLQDAGFAGLQGLVYGNESGERAVRFLQKMKKARDEGRSVTAELVSDLQDEVAPFIGVVPIGTALDPIVKAMQLDPSALAWSAQELADAWEIGEPLVRAAQAILHGGSPDEALRAQIYADRVRTLGKVVVSDADRAAADAAWAAKVAANPGVPEICLRAEDARARGSPAAASLESQCAAYREAHKFDATKDVRALTSSSIYTIGLAQPQVVRPASKLVPFAPPKIVSPVASARPPGELGTTTAVVGGVAGVGLVALAWWALT